MAKLYNLCRVRTATTGTGALVVGAAVPGFLTFALAGVANGDVVAYAIRDGSSSELGYGTYTSATLTLTRTVRKSTNSDAAISLSGNAIVTISPSAEDLQSDIALSDGTAAAPALAFQGDDDTGLYRIGANEVGFSVGGAGTGFGLGSTAGLYFIGTGHPGLRLNNLTTTQRNALSPAAGQVIFNTTTNIPNVYAAGSWQPVALFDPTTTALISLSFSSTTNMGLRLNNLTTTQRDAVTDAANGGLIYNTTTDRINVYVGPTWRVLSHLDGDQTWSGANTYSAAISFSGTTHVGINLNSLTTTQRNAISSPANGALVYNSTTGALNFYGNAWLAAPILSGTNAWTGGQQTFTSATNSAGEPFSIVQGWNNGASDFYGLAVNVSNGSGGAPVGSTASRLFDFRVNSASMFAVNTSGNLWVNNNRFFGLLTTGNLFFGTLTLAALTSGVNNIAIGANVLQAVTEGDNNVGVGDAVLTDLTTADGNTGIGFQALNNTTTGIENAAVGSQALIGNTTGQWNGAFGSYALDGNTTGSQNTGVGTNAGYLQTTGSDNVWVGYRSGRGAAAVNYVSTGVVAIGVRVMEDAATGCDYNTAVGYEAGANITTGANNILLGKSTAGTLTTGSSNIIIGVGIDVAAAGTSNIIKIGSVIEYNVSTANAWTMSGAGGLYVTAGGVDVTGESDFRGNVYLFSGAGLYARALAPIGFGSTGYLQWSNNTDGAAGSADLRVRRIASGSISIDNNANAFTSMLLGGSGTTYNMIKHDATGVLAIKFADDSAYSNLRVKSLYTPMTGELTIATGVITVTGGYHNVDTEADAASDDLDTINGGVDGMRLVLRANHTDRTVVVKDGTGNIQIAGDMTLDNTQDTIELIYDSTLTAWLEIGRAASGA